MMNIMMNHHLISWTKKQQTNRLEVGYIYNFFSKLIKAHEAKHVLVPTDVR